MSNEIDWQRLRTSYEAHIRELNTRVATTRRCQVCGEPWSAVVEHCPFGDGAVDWEVRETMQDFLDLNES